MTALGSFPTDIHVQFATSAKVLQVPLGQSEPVRASAVERPDHPGWGNARGNGPDRSERDSGSADEAGTRS